MPPRVNRFGKPPFPRTRFLLIGARGFRAVDTGDKTSLIVPVSLAPFVVELRRGQFLDLHWVKDPQHWRRVQVSWVCRHRKLASVPTCARDHDPARIDPGDPRWGTVLVRASNGGDWRMRESKRLARAVQGFAVVDFRAAPGDVQGTDAPPFPAH